MLHDQSLVTSFFKLLNVGVLIGVGVYFFIKNFRVQIIKDMIDERAKERALEEERRAAIVKQHELEQAEQEQRRWYEMVKKNITVWNDMVAQDHAEQRRIFEQQQKKFQATREQQVEYLIAAKARALVMPQALTTATQDLIKRNRGAQQGATAVARIIDHLKESRA